MYRTIQRAAVVFCDAVRWTEFPVSGDLARVNEFIDLRAAYMEQYTAALSDRLS